MKIGKIIKIITISLLFVSCLDQAKVSPSELRVIETKKSELLERLGPMNCVREEMSNMFEYCENKQHICYLFTSHKKGGLSCFPKGKI